VTVPKQPVVQVPPASGRCGIPSGGVAPPANIPDILGRRALSAGRLVALGAVSRLEPRPATTAARQARPEAGGSYQLCLMLVSRRTDADSSSPVPDSSCAAGGGLSRTAPFDVAQGVVSAVEPRTPVGSGQNLHAGRRRPLVAGVWSTCEHRAQPRWCP